MRILVVTNLYPPHHIGGYELGCHDVVKALQARGHAVHVLTSRFRLSDDPVTEAGVERELQYVGGPADGRHQKMRECRVLSRVVREQRPDVVYFWNQAGLSHWLPMMARLLRCRMAFFLSDTHFVSWRVGAFLTRWALHGSAAFPARTIRAVFGGTFLIRGWPVMRNQPCHFASRFLRGCADRAGIAVAEDTSIVAHWGIDPRNFAPPQESRWPLNRLLYVGQLIPQKGVHTAIAALALLAREPAFASMSLSVAGGGMHPEYEKELRALAVQSGLGERVHFLGKIPRPELPEVYAKHDVLIFPSEWDEPFAITPLEAAAAGLAIVGTTTGGSGEFFRHGETAMTFAAGDPEDCARALRQLCGDRSLAETIRAHAHREVTERFTIDNMVATIEQSLRQIVEPRASVG